MNKKKPSLELLSPAGNWESLKAAVANGADAVYFGLGKYNARRRAENFSEKDLENIVYFCHHDGVKAYLAMNTLVKNQELREYFKLMNDAYTAGVDAVIVQDISFIPIIKQNFPGLGIHLSTQASVFNSYHSGLLKGVDRVILPREFTINQVKEFHDKTKIPVEVFVQGALCFCISGQCLMSSFLGGRSGNRGLCAQPCRKQYNKSFILSTRDLCLIDKLPQILEAGASCIKIEGRLRSPHYVAAATSLYRRAIDSLGRGRYKIDSDALFDLELAFSRRYTKGMLFKERYVVTPEEGGKRGIILGVLGRNGGIRLKTSIMRGDGVGIVTKKGMHGDVIRKIEANGKSVDSAEAGKTVRLFINAREGDEIILTSGSHRRQPYLSKEKDRIVLERKKPARITLPETGGELEEARLLIKAYSARDAKIAIASGADRAYYDLFAKDYFKAGEGVCPYIPRCLNDWAAEKAMNLIKDLSPRSVLCGDPGLASNLSGTEVYLDISGNVFNDIAVSFWNHRNVVPIISPELSFKELKEFRNKRFAVYAHGRVPLMSTKYLLKEDRLSDEKGYVFPVRTEGDYRQVLNSVKLGIFDGAGDLMKNGIRQFLLDLDEDVAESVSLYKKIVSGEKTKKPKGEYTLGNYRKGVA